MAWVLEHTEVYTNRTGDEIGVAGTSRTAVDGTSVHAGTTANTFQSLPVLRVGDSIAAPVVKQHHVHLSPRAGLPEMRGEAGRWLACATAAEQPLEDGERVVVGDELLYTHGHDVELRHGGRHIRIALIGADHDVAGLRHTEVAAGESCLCFFKFMAQALTGTVGEVGRVAVAFLGTDSLFFKTFGYLFLCDVDGRHDDVCRLAVHELQDTLAEVGLYYINSTADEVRVESALLCEHRFRLHHLRHLVALEDVIDGGIELIGILGPVDDDSTALQLCGELFEVVGEMRDGVHLDL